jgi:DNA-binding response OmpR family regulator
MKNPAAIKAAQGAQILIIEDDLGMRELLAVHLREAGYRVRTAADGHVGGTMLLESCPDLLLLDLRMPHIAGDELLSLIRGDATLKNLKVVVLTMLRGSAINEEIERLGVSALLHKPVQKDELLAAVTKALQG